MSYNTDALDAFIETHYKEVYDCVASRRPELFPNNDITLDDIDDDLIMKYIMMDDVLSQQFTFSSYNILSMDSKCVEILAYQMKQLDKSGPKPSKFYINLAKDYILHSNADEVMSILHNHTSYMFNPKKVIDRITDSMPVTSVIAPYIVGRMDKDNIGMHILLEMIPQGDDYIVSKLLLDPLCVKQLLRLSGDLGYVHAGLNAEGDTFNAPISLIIGKNEKVVLEYKDKLKQTMKGSDN